MTAQNLFLLAFLSQIILISVYFPSMIVRRMTYVFEHFPPQSHPRLYPRSLDHYERKRSVYKAVNGLVAAAGLVAFALLLQGDNDPDLFNRVAFYLFLIQVAPALWLEWSLRGELKLMRELNTRSTRMADLSRRRLFDVMPPVLFVLIVAVYVAFWIFIAWFRQFDYPWFGGFLNNVIITGMNLFFASILAWRMFGRKLNPHQSAEDRMRSTRRVALSLGLVSIAATLYAVLTISLSAADAREFQPFARSLYFQLVMFMSFQVYRIDAMNFDVYRRDLPAT